ncbi:hypothetical protein AKJ16_DCAP21981 [Drosera capensis]
MWFASLCSIVVCLVVFDFRALMIMVLLKGKKKKKKKKNSECFFFGLELLLDHECILYPSKISDLCMFGYAGETGLLVPRHSQLVETIMEIQRTCNLHDYGHQPLSRQEETAETMDADLVFVNQVEPLNVVQPFPCSMITSFRDMIEEDLNSIKSSFGLHLVSHVSSNMAPQLDQMSWLLARKKGKSVVVPSSSPANPVPLARLSPLRQPSSPVQSEELIRAVSSGPQSEGGVVFETPVGPFYLSTPSTCRRGGLIAGLENTIEDDYHLMHQMISNYLGLAYKAERSKVEVEFHET